MISNKIMVVNIVLVILGITAFFYFQYQVRPETLGGYEDGTEQYFGYRYARDNELKAADQCDDEKDDPEMNINDEFLEGCKTYFQR